MSISVKNVTKKYNTQKALNNISFEITKGEIIGFLGPNGAGKSTMMKIITCYIPASEGEVFVCGINVENDPIAVQKKIGYLPEHNPLYLDMYVAELLSFIADIHKIEDKKNRIEEMISLTGLTPERNKKIKQLSKGYRQRVGLAAAMIHDPEVLILDEPTTGLDPNQIVEIRNLIKSIGQQKTVMLSTHIMQEVEAICSRAIIINKGEIVADNKISELPQMGNNQLKITVEFESNIDKAIFENVDGIESINQLNQTTLIFVAKSDSDPRGEISKIALNNDNIILSISKEEKSLESVFQSLTNK